MMATIEDILKRFELMRARFCAAPGCGRPVRHLMKGRRTTTCSRACQRRLFHLNKKKGIPLKRKV